MLRHQLLLAFRNFTKFKSIFAINLLGLAMGLTTVILIMLWMKDELAFNKYHEKGDRIYQVMTNHDNSGGIVTFDSGPGLLAEAMGEEFPQIEKVAATSPFITGVSLSEEENIISGSGLFVDQAYFDIFSVKFLSGNPDQAVTDLNSIVLSSSIAKKLFGSTENALGKSLSWQVFDFGNEVKVTGVYQDFPFHSTERPDFLLAFPYFKIMLGEGLHWDNHNASTYFLLAEGVNPNEFNPLTEKFIQSKLAESNVTLLPQLFKDRYLYGSYEDGKVAGGRISYVKLFSGIALFILLIACINFMNLTTARSMSRLKEIGVKKSMGASRQGLFYQFLVESMLLSFLALILAITFSYLLQPVFNQLTGKTLGLNFQRDLILILVGVWLATSFLAGIYPAVYLSKFKPMVVMKSNLKGSFGELLARKGLVVFQFAISLLLIIGISVIGKQMSFIQSQNLGYDQSHMLQINASMISPTQLESFLEQVKSVPGVENASSLNHPLVGMRSSTIGLTWEGKTEEDVKFENISVNMDLIETMGFELVAGRSFSPDFGAENDKIILNESAIRIIGFEEPIGKIVNLWGEDKEVIGVVKDFNFESLKETVKPAFIKYDPAFAEKVMVRLSPENQQASIAGISKIFESTTSQILEYSFLDEDYQTLYQAEQRMAQLARYFGIVAIFLSCLGLFGLAAFTAEKRKKEIGVRKVMGASKMGILTLVSKDFVQLVLVSILISIPLGWYFANSWLETYATQTNLSWWIFAGSGILLLIIALGTVGFQAYKAASANPVKSLRSE